MAPERGLRKRRMNATANPEMRVAKMAGLLRAARTASHDMNGEQAVWRVAIDFFTVRERQTGVVEESFAGGISCG